MPLESGGSKATISKNIATERRAGKSPEQAAAIAYSVAGQGKDDDESSARVVDSNGWWEIQDNPISKAGVFEYLGAKLPFEDLGLDPDKFYSVLRPPEELADPECINSFRLLPWINNHTMLGPDGKPGTMPAEKKGIGGVIGEQIYFNTDDDTLYGNIKCLSNAIADAVNAGKNELSCGYRCRYEWAPGVYKGTPYQLVQRVIRGNHLATVDEGRMGPSVAVMDGFSFTCDSKDFQQMADENKEKGGDDKGTDTPDLAAAIKAIEALQPLIKIITDTAGMLSGAAPTTDPDADAALDDDSAGGGAVNTAATDDDDTSGDGKGGAAAAQPKPADGKGTDADDDGKGGAAGKGADADDAGKGEGEGMDAMEKETVARIGRKTTMAKRISAHVGTFDHSAMTEAEVYAYGVRKLGLKNIPKGHEATALGAWLDAKGDPRKRAVTGTGQDGKDKPLAKNPLASKFA